MQKSGFTLPNLQVIREKGRGKGEEELQTCFIPCTQVSPPLFHTPHMVSAGQEVPQGDPSQGHDSQYPTQRIILAWAKGKSDSKNKEGTEPMGRHPNHPLGHQLHSISHRQWHTAHTGWLQAGKAGCKSLQILNKQNHLLQWFSSKENTISTKNSFFK